MNVTKTLVAAGFAVLFMLVWNSQSSFGQHGHTFRTGASPVGSSAAASKARSFRTPGTPSMRRPTRTTNRGRSIGVAGGGNAAGPVGGEGAVGARGGERAARPSRGERAARPSRGERAVGPVGGEGAVRSRGGSARTSSRGRSIGVAAVGGEGYSDIHRKTSRTTRPPKAGGATAQFF